MRRLVTIILIFAIQFLISVPTAWTQTVTGTVGVGTNPNGVGVNPVTDKVYVANRGSNNITVINGETNTTTTVTDPNAVQPYGVAVNPVTNKIYVANANSNNVTVIDGSTDTVLATVAAGTGPIFAAVNPVTDKIYVINATSNNVTVIDGATNATTTVPVGTVPQGLALNPVTNRIYVANRGSNNVTVIDGATNGTATVADPNATNPQVVTVNAVTDKIYVGNNTSANVTVIDGATNTTTTVTVGGTGPNEIAVNPVTNKIYVTTFVTNNMTVIDGATNATTTVAVGNVPIAVAVNPTTNQIYVANNSGSTVTVVDGATNATTTVKTGSGPFGVGVNPVTDRIYVTNSGSNNVTVIGGATNTTTTVTDPNAVAPFAVAVNPVTDKTYVANFSSNNVTVIDGATNTTATVAVGSGPNSVAVNPVTDKIYVANQTTNNVTVIDGATNSTTTVAVEVGPGELAVNPVTDKIYVGGQGNNNVTVIDGGTNTTATVALGVGADGVAVNPVTNKIYVADHNTPGTVTVIDGATDSIVATVSAGSDPGLVAVNPVTNKIYVTNINSANVTVIDGSTDTVVATVPASTSPSEGLAVNPVTNQIYVTSTLGNATVIDGVTNLATTVGTGLGPVAVAVNPVTNKIYVANAFNGTNGNSVTVIDGTTNSTTMVAVGVTPVAVAVNPVTNKIYVANKATNNVTVLDEQQVQAVPLTAGITPLAGNVTASPTPTFNFTASSAFSPTATTPDNLLFQVDSWQGPWTAATNNGGGNFSGTTVTLQPGFHNLYAYATDGQEATSTITVTQSSPLIGNIVGYGFLVTSATSGPVFSASPSPLAFGRVSDGATSSLTLTVTNTGSANLTFGTGALSLSGTNAADFAAIGGCDGQTVAPDLNCQETVTFTPSIVGSETAALNFIDNAAGSPQSISLTGTGLAAPAASFSPSSVTFPGQVINTPGAAIPVTLTNTGLAAMTIATGGISPTGDFSETNNCPVSPTTLGIGASCTINVTFTPTVTGADVGTLQVSDNAPGSPQIVTLTGTGFSAGVPSSSSRSVNFDSRPVGTTTAATTLTFTNTGSGPLGISSIAATDTLAIPCDPTSQPGCDPGTQGSLPYQFHETNNCPSSLAARASCTINVTYTPLTLGTLSGSLTITDDGATGTLVIGLGGTATAVPFANGEVFLGVSNGKIQRRSASGALIQVIGAGVAGDIAGMAFDSAGNLYATGFQALKIQKFDSSGNLLGTFADFSALALTGKPESILFDETGNAYVGAPDNTYIYKFDSQGNLLTKFNVAVESRGTDWVEIASDQCTIYYTSEGTSILRYNVCTQTQLPNLTGALGGPAYALRIRPNGEVLVADSPKVVRLDASANILQTYTPTNTGNLFGLNLDPDGTSFWTADLAGTQVYKLDIATGNPLVQYTVDSPDVGGITVKGEINVATSPALTLSPASLVMPDTPLNLSCTPRVLTVTNSGNGTLSLSSIATSDSAVFAISGDTCPVGTGTLAAGASCQVSVTFHPTAIGTATGSLTITSNAPGSPASVPLSGTGKAACPLAAAAQTERVLRGTNRTTFTVMPNATCQATDQIALACVNAQPATCAFNPGTIQNPQQSVLSMTNLGAISASGLQFEVTGTSADFIQRTLYLQVLFSDFSFTPYPDAETVGAGGTATYGLAVVPVNGLAGQVSLACSGAPAGGSCTVTPSVVSVANNLPAEVQVKVQTASRGMTGPAGEPEPRLPGGRWLLLAWGLLALAVAGYGRRCAQGKKSSPAKARPMKGLRWAVGLAMLLAVAAWGSCGGGGMSPPGGGGSAAGTYTLVVTGTFAPTGTTTVVMDPTAPPLERQTKLTLNVQ